MVIFGGEWHYAVLSHKITLCDPPDLLRNSGSLNKWEIWCKIGNIWETKYAEIMWVSSSLQAPRVQLNYEDITSQPHLYCIYVTNTLISANEFYKVQIVFLHVGGPAHPFRCPVDGILVESQWSVRKMRRMNDLAGFKKYANFVKGIHLQFTQLATYLNVILDLRQSLVQRSTSVPLPHCSDYTHVP
jgi:hypothetical protein